MNFADDSFLQKTKIIIEYENKPLFKRKYASL